MSILEQFSLKGKVALVTGGAAKLSLQIVKALCEVGADMVIADVAREALDARAEELKALGFSVEGLTFDQGDAQSILELRDKVVQTRGRIDVLVNGAIVRPMKGFDDAPEAFAESMRINATGTFVLSRTFGDAMAEAGGGSIIQIGSIQGMIGPDSTLYEGLGMHGFYPDYFFHKGGMMNLTRFLAAYYGPRQVRCNCILPGGLESDRTPAEFVRRYSERTFLGRMANQSDLMGTVVFLASDASAYITGVNIPVDGGYTAK